MKLIDTKSTDDIRVVITEGQIVSDKPLTEESVRMEADKLTAKSGLQSLEEVHCEVYARQSVITSIKVTKVYRKPLASGTPTFLGAEELALLNAVKEAAETDQHSHDTVRQNHTNCKVCAALTALRRHREANKESRGK